MNKIKIFFLLTFLCQNIIEAAIAPQFPPLKTTGGLEQFQHGLWITNEKILATADNGSTVINISTNEVIHSDINNHAEMDIACNGAYYAISSGKTVQCFNALTDESVWKKKRLCTNHPISFISQDKDTVVCLTKPRPHSSDDSIIVMSLPDQKAIHAFSDTQALYNGSLSWHPSTNKILLHKNTASCSKYPQGNSFTYMIDELSYLKIYTIDTNAEPIKEVKYSPDGEEIIINYGNIIASMKHGSQEDWQYIAMTRALYQASMDRQRIMPTTQTSYVSLEFYDNNTIVLLTADGIVQIFDRSQQQIINEIHFNNSTNSQMLSVGKRLSISPDRKNILVTLENGCFVIPMLKALSKI